MKTIILVVIVFTISMTLIIYNSWSRNDKFDYHPTTTIETEVVSILEEQVRCKSWGGDFIVTSQYFNFYGELVDRIACVRVIERTEDSGVVLKGREYLFDYKFDY